MKAKKLFLLILIFSIEHCLYGNISDAAIRDKITKENISLNQYPRRLSVSLGYVFSLSDGIYDNNFQYNANINSPSYPNIILKSPSSVNYFNMNHGAYINFGFDIFPLRSVFDTSLFFKLPIHVSYNYLNFNLSNSTQYSKPAITVGTITTAGYVNYIHSTISLNHFIEATINPTAVFFDGYFSSKSSLELFIKAGLGLFTGYRDRQIKTFSTNIIQIAPLYVNSTSELYISPNITCGGGLILNFTNYLGLSIEYSWTPAPVFEGVTINNIHIAKSGLIFKF